MLTVDEIKRAVAFELSHRHPLLNALSTFTVTEMSHSMDVRISSSLERRGKGDAWNGCVLLAKSELAAGGHSVIRLNLGTFLDHFETSFANRITLTKDQSDEDPKG